METLIYTGTLVVRRCWCGIRHAIPSELDAQLLRSRENHAFCPLGHRYVQKDPTEEERIASLEARLTHERDQREAAERRVSAARGQVTKLKNRIHAGVCPHCKRTFQDVARHMKSKHAEQMETASRGSAS
jgi:DNA-binding transcriptional LysR family regulator